MFTNIQANVFSSGAGGSLSQAFSVAGSLGANAQSSQSVQAQLSSVVASQVQGVSVSLSKQGVQLSQAVKGVSKGALPSGKDFPPNLLKETAAEFPPNYLKQGANLAKSMLKKASEEFPPNYLKQNQSSALQTKPVTDFPPDYVKQAHENFPQKLSGKPQREEFPKDLLKESPLTSQNNADSTFAGVKGIEQQAAEAYRSNI